MGVGDNAVKLCPTCGRRPSERHAFWDSSPPCDDSIHDIADAGPELLETLEAFGSFDCVKLLRGDLACTPADACDACQARFVIARARGGEVQQP